MKKEIELSGYWWVIGYEDIRIFGTLDIASTTLSLIGKLSNTSTFSPFNELSKYERIEGISTTNKRIILKNCWETGRESQLLIDSAPYLPPSVTKVFASQVFVTENSNYVQNLELSFNEVFATFSHLPDWLGPRLVSSDFIVDSFGKSKGVEAKLEYLDVPEIMLSNFKVTIRQGFTTSGDSIRIHSIHPSVGLLIQHNEYLSVETWMRDFIRPLNNFLSLALGQSTDITGVLAYHDSNTKKIRFENERFADEAIPLYFYDTQIAINQSKNYEEPNFKTNVFDLRDIRDNIQEVFENWFSINNNEARRRIIDLLSSIERSPQMPIEDKFLNTIRALEVYHREHFSNSVLPAEEHKQRVEKILSALPNESQEEKDIRKWLKEKLNYSNEPTLKQRIKELFESPNPFTDLITKNVDKYAKLTSKTRNFLTHPSDNKRGVLDFTGMYYFQKNMVLMLKTFLLRDIGVNVGTDFSGFHNLLRGSFKDISKYLGD